MDERTDYEVYEPSHSMREQILAGNARLAMLRHLFVLDHKLLLGIWQPSSTVSIARSQTILAVRLCAVANPKSRGPIEEYDARIASGRLRDDQHQRSQFQYFRQCAFPG